MYVRYRYMPVSMFCRLLWIVNSLPQNRQLKGLKVLSISTLTAKFSVWVYCGCPRSVASLTRVVHGSQPIR